MIAIVPAKNWWLHIQLAQLTGNAHRLPNETVGKRIKTYAQGIIPPIITAICGQLREMTGLLPTATE